MASTVNSSTNTPSESSLILAPCRFCFILLMKYCIWVDHASLSLLCQAAKIISFLLRWLLINADLVPQLHVLKMLLTTPEWSHVCLCPKQVWATNHISDGVGWLCTRQWRSQLGGRCRNWLSKIPLAQAVVCVAHQLGCKVCIPICYTCHKEMSTENLCSGIKFLSYRMRFSPCAASTHNGLLDLSCRHVIQMYLVCYQDCFLHIKLTALHSLLDLPLQEWHSRSIGLQDWALLL